MPVSSRGSRPDASPPEPVPIRPRRLGAGFRSLLATALAFCAFLAANALSSRIWARGEFAHHVRGAVSEESRLRLSGLTGSARVTAFFERSSPLRNPARRMLADFADISAETPGLAIAVESIDANHDLPRAEALARRRPVVANSILVEAGGRFAVLSGADLFRRPGRGGVPVFAGDVACAEALVSLLSTGGGGVFAFMREHDETESAGTTPADFPLARLLRAGGYETADAVSFGGWLPGSQRAAVAVCNCPRIPWTAAEASEAVSFLENGGRMLLLAGSAAAGPFGGFWAQCGISPELPAAAVPPVQARAAAVPGHPVSDGAGGASLLFSDALFFSPPAAAGNHRPAGDPEVSVLAAPRKGFGAKDAAPPPAPALALALEWPGISASGRSGRLVVIGDGAFATDAALGASPGNGRFAMAAAAWLSSP